jgi:hypothetical protein
MKVVDGTRMAAGAGAGAAATVAMTGWMLGGQALSRHGEQPPKRLVRGLGRRAGLPARRLGPGTLATSAAAHLGFGASCGALYSLMVPRSSAPRGIAFGLVVWATSYAGWIPALGLMPPPHRDTRGRALTAMTAHLVYGGVLGAALAARDRGRQHGR